MSVLTVGKMINNDKTPLLNEWLNLILSDFFNVNSTNASKLHSHTLLTLINKHKGMLKCISLLRGRSGHCAFVPSRHVFPVIVVSDLKKKKKRNKSRHQAEIESMNQI